MRSSGASSHTTSGGLSPSGKVVSLSNRAWGVVCAPASMKVNTPCDPRMLRSGSVAATPATVSLVRTWAWVRAGGKVVIPSVWVGAGRKVGLTYLLGVPAGPAWRACIGTRLSGSAGRVL